MIFPYCETFYDARVAQLVRATGLHPVGRGFESLLAYQSSFRAKQETKTVPAYRREAGPQSPKSTSTLRSTLRLGKPVFQATFDIQFDNDSILLRLHSHIGLGESTLRGRHHRSQQTTGGSQSRSRLPYVQVPPLENPDRNRLRFQRKGLRIRTLPQVARRQRIRKATFLNTEPILTNRFPCRSVL